VDRVALLDPVLLAARPDDRVHGLLPPADQSQLQGTLERSTRLKIASNLGAGRASDGRERRAEGA
jgi:hypothetical protein